MVKIITPMAKKVYTVTPNSMRAELAEELINEVIKYNETCKAYMIIKMLLKKLIKLQEKMICFY